MRTLVGPGVGHRVDLPVPDMLVSTGPTTCIPKYSLVMSPVDATGAASAEGDVDDDVSGARDAPAGVSPFSGAAGGTEETAVAWDRRSRARAATGDPWVTPATVDDEESSVIAGVDPKDTTGTASNRLATVVTTARRPRERRTVGRTAGRTVGRAEVRTEGCAEWRAGAPEDPVRCRFVTNVEPRVRVRSRSVNGLRVT